MDPHLGSHPHRAVARFDDAPDPPQTGLKQRPGLPVIAKHLVSAASHDVAIGKRGNGEHAAGGIAEAGIERMGQPEPLVPAPAGCAPQPEFSIAALNDHAQVADLACRRNLQVGTELVAGVDFQPRCGLARLGGCRPESASPFRL